MFAQLNKAWQRVKNKTLEIINTYQKIINDNNFVQKHQKITLF